MRFRGTAFREAALTISLLFAAAAPSGVAAAADRAVILILDASGSMNLVRPNGKTGFEEATERLGKTLDADLAQGADVGLLVFGGAVGDCNDVRMVVPPGPDTGGAIRAAVRSVVPNGLTPLTAAIEAARNYFGSNLAQTYEIALFTDGAENCGRDPVAMVSAGRASGRLSKVDIVGINVGPGEEAQLDAVAMAGGGSFLNIPAVFPMSIVRSAFAPPGALPPRFPLPPLFKRPPKAPEKDDYKPPSIDASIFDKEIDFGSKTAKQDTPPPPPKPTPQPPVPVKRPDVSEKPEPRKPASVPVPKPNLPPVNAPPMLLP